MNIFQQILECRSLTVIGYMAEDALAQAANEEERRTLQAIVKTNQLDEIYALAHEHLGQHAEALTLRAFMARRQPRKLSPELAQILEL